jgi:hypothetical protein
MKELKVYVEVTARFDLNGNISPLSLIWKDGKAYEISKIKDIRPAASLKAGGAGTRYTCTFDSVERYLFLEENKWFVEGKT